MDEILNQIIEIEKKAQDIMNEARIVKDELLGTIDHDIEDLKKSYIERETNRIALVRKDEDEFTAKAIDAIENDKTKFLNNLQKNYVTNCEIWVNTMFDNIVNS